MQDDFITVTKNIDSKGNTFYTIDVLKRPTVTYVVYADNAEEAIDIVKKHENILG